LCYVALVASPYIEERKWAPVPYLSPPAFTRTEVEAILTVIRVHPRDHLVIALALGAGLRLGEIVGLNVGDVHRPDGRPRTRVHIRAEIAKGGKAGDVFLPDALVRAGISGSSHLPCRQIARSGVLLFRERSRSPFDLSGTVLAAVPLCVPEGTRIVVEE
jgi:integrase